MKKVAAKFWEDASIRIQEPLMEAEARFYSNEITGSELHKIWRKQVNEWLNLVAKPLIEIKENEVVIRGEEFGIDKISFYDYEDADSIIMEEIG